MLRLALCRPTEQKAGYGISQTPVGSAMCQDSEMIDQLQSTSEAIRLLRSHGMEIVKI
jgi:hypothetical protein